MMSSAQNSTSNAPGQARKRQTRRDEIIRKKAEADLNKKMNQTKHRGPPGSGEMPQSPAVGAGSSTTAVPGRKRAAAGTVAALRPAPALTVREGISITEAAQLMAAKRADSVLVVDDEERLAGIFTAKDVAFRVVAEGLDARTTQVREIATRDPLCVTSDTSATDALNTMVGRGFRHLPVCNEEGDVVGLLDVIRCMYEALEKMERAHQSSKALYAAIEGVEKEWSVQSAQMLQFVDTLRERMSFPDMTTVLDGTDPVIVSPKTPVMDIARQMRAARVTASLIVDDETGNIAGIFTSKDIVLRVIAAGLDPRTCSVVRVMTPHPDTVVPSTSLIDALKRMYERHYLNLPVVEESTGEILGLVDVLRLCYATLEQMKSIQGAGIDDNVAAGGPMWSRFFSGNLPAELGGPVSAVSDPMHNSQVGSFTQPPPSFVDGTARLASEVYPNESASMIEDIHSAVNSRVGEQDPYAFGYADHSAAQYAAYNQMMQQQQMQQQQQQQQQAMMPMPQQYAQTQQAYSNLGSQAVFSQQGIPAASATGSGSMMQSQAQLSGAPEGHFVFKLKTPSGKTHRFTAPIGDLGHVRMMCVKKLVSEGVKEAQTLIDESGLAYVDDEGDFVHITGASDLADAIDLATRDGKGRVLLQINPRALVYLDEKEAESDAQSQLKQQELGPLGIPEKYLVPTALGGGFVTALFCVWLAVKLSKN
ncbi:CBS-domain-containing protein [Martensiomyces pterosporus]|nr:CBS-domain-containing protein [Martensiomyces pterosporus]